MAAHFLASSPGHWSPGGLLGAAPPKDGDPFPPRVLMRYIDASGTVQIGEIDVVESTAPIPGEIDWSKVVDWVDITKIR